MEVISIDSDEDVSELRSPFLKTKTVVTPSKRNESATLTTIQHKDSNLLNTSIDLDCDIYGLIFGKKEEELRRLHSKAKKDIVPKQNVETQPVRKYTIAEKYYSELEKDSLEDEKIVPITKSTLIAKKSSDGSSIKKKKKTKKSSTMPSDASNIVSSKKKLIIDNDVESDHSETTHKRKYLVYADSDDSGYNSCSSTTSTQSAKEQSKFEKDYAKRARGAYALEELHVHIDSNLINSVGGKAIREQLELRFDKSRIVVSNSSIAHSIQWTRHLPMGYVRWLEQCSGQSSQHEETDELVFELSKYLVIRIPGDTLVELIQSNSLLKYVNCVQAYRRDSPNTALKLYDEGEKPQTLILLVEGLHSFLKSIELAKYHRIMADVNKTGKANKSSKADDTPTLSCVERVLLEMQLIHGVQVFETANASGTVQFISQMTKNLAKAPYKEHISILDFKSSSAPNCRKKLKLSEIWRKQLMEIPSVSEKIANVVADKYPSVKSLLLAYDAFEGEEKNMLKDIQLDQKRKVGPVASESIYKLFGNE